MMAFEEDLLLVDKEDAEESGRGELQVKEEAVDGSEELSEYQDEGPDIKPSDVRIVQAKKELDDIDEEDLVADKEADGDANDKDKRQDE